MVQGAGQAAARAAHPEVLPGHGLRCAGPAAAADDGGPRVGAGEYSVKWPSPPTSRTSMPDLPRACLAEPARPAGGARSGDIDRPSFPEHCRDAQWSHDQRADGFHHRGDGRQDSCRQRQVGQLWRLALNLWYARPALRSGLSRRPPPATMPIMPRDLELTVLRTPDGSLRVVFLPSSLWPMTVA